MAQPIKYADRVRAHVRSNPGLRAGQIAEALGLEYSDVNGQLQFCIRKGMMTRKYVAASDRRWAGTFIYYWNDNPPKIERHKWSHRKPTNLMQ